MQDAGPADRARRSRLGPGGVLVRQDPLSRRPGRLCDPDRPAAIVPGGRITTRCRRPISPSKPSCCRDRFTTRPGAGRGRQVGRRHEVPWLAVRHHRQGLAPQAADAGDATSSDAWLDGSFGEAGRFLRSAYSARQALLSGRRAEAGARHTGTRRASRAASRSSSKTCRTTTSRCWWPRFRIR